MICSRLLHYRSSWQPEYLDQWNRQPRISSTPLWWNDKRLEFEQKRITKQSCANAGLGKLKGSQEAMISSRMSGLHMTACSARLCLGLAQQEAIMARRWYASRQASRWRQTREDQKLIMTPDDHDSQQVKLR